MRRTNDNPKHVTLQVQKRHRLVTIGKLVRARPLRELVLAMPYRNRRTVTTVSIPPAVLRYAQAHGAKFWIVRFDEAGICYSLPLADVTRAGWLKPSDGMPEYFVSLENFERIPYQDWPFVERSVLIDTAAHGPCDPPEGSSSEPRQLGWAL